MTQRTAPMFDKITYIWLYVTNLDRSITFYQTGLGLKLTSKWHEGATFDAGNVVLGLHLEEGPTTRGNSPVITLNAAFDIGRIHTELIRREAANVGGVTEEPYGKVLSLRG